MQGTGPGAPLGQETDVSIIDVWTALLSDDPDELDGALATMALRGGPGPASPPTWTRSGPQRSPAEFDQVDAARRITRLGSIRGPALPYGVALRRCLMALPYGSSGGLTRPWCVRERSRTFPSVPGPARP